MFDPLGIILPVKVRARLFAQELWKVKSGLDEKLTDTLSKEWLKIYKEVQESLRITIPRQVCVGVKVHFHLFSDASTKAYGATAYACNEWGSELLLAKGKVAPNKLY